MLKSSDTHLLIHRLYCGCRKVELWLQAGCTVVAGSLAVGSTVTAPLTIDFNDTTQLAQFDLCTSSRKYSVSIAAPVGELLRPHTLNEKEFVTLQSESVWLCCVSE